MNENPWQVDSVQAFAFLNCPECTFKTREETFFQVKNFEITFCFASILGPLALLTRNDSNCLSKLGIKLCLYLVEISILSINHVIVRLKITNNV